MEGCYRYLKTDDRRKHLGLTKFICVPMLEYGVLQFVQIQQTFERAQNSYTGKMFQRLGVNYRIIPSSARRNSQLVIEMLDFRMRKFDMVLVYKILHGLEHVDRLQYFPVKSSITRKPKPKMLLPNARASVRSHYFICMAGNEYVKLC